MQFISLYECAIKEQSFLIKYRPSLNSRLFATTSTRLTYLEDPNALSPRFSSEKVSHLNNENLTISTSKNSLSINDSLDLTKVSTEEEISVIPEAINKKDVSHWLIVPNKPVQIYNVKGVNIGSFLTYREAGRELGVSHTLISRYGKSTDAFYSPALGIFVSVSIDTVEKIGRVTHPYPNIYPTLELKLNLPKGKICAVSSDLSNIVNTFKSFKEAAQYFELPDYRKIRRYFGTKKLIKTTKGDFYFTGEPEIIKFYQENKAIPNKTILAYDLSKGCEDLNDSNSKKYNFVSINQAENLLKIHHTTIIRHLDKGTIYNGQDGRKFKFMLG
uniref:GIY-YIG endonuclease n=1 Tax=Sphaerobolus stellatus TaxID=68786 RepID=A0A7D4ZE72_9AGAM|nr:GIY-YIG endonuclease [Sphaerobolus stellatus]